ncbi:hypothetical protein [Streptomyces jumonjinensis]|uniref:hypothetical protein n=1 Tax=Streptomyces jumonjinensis TaxID=1945 RepID=UPI0037B2DDD9
MSEELRDEGRAEVLPMVAEAILMFLEQRGIDIPDDARERITSCDDPETMHHWLTRTATAPSAEAVFDDA